MDSPVLFALAAAAALIGLALFVVSLAMPDNGCVTTDDGHSRTTQCSFTPGGPRGTAIMAGIFWIGAAALTAFALQRHQGIRG